MAHAQTITLPELPAHLFDEQPNERTQFLALRQRLFAECLPGTHIEVETFERYAWALFMAQRFRLFEVDSQSQWAENPLDPTTFRLMERLSLLAAQQERRADRALNELRKLQRDRSVAAEVQNEMYCMDEQCPIPVSLPLHEMRRTHSRFLLAVQWLSAQPDIQLDFAKLHERRAQQLTQ
jgi:hypothetical protein